jgi:DNA invertase Pin-like site-specific DNA recombinase
VSKVNAKPVRAFAYLRVSGRSQIDHDGFPRQRLAIQQYAISNGIKIVKWFEERGVTGSRETMDRPAYSAMLAELLGDGVGTVVIERLDRLARHLMTQEAAIGDLRKNGFELLSVAEPDLCSDDPTRILTRQLLGAVAQYDKSQIVAKLRGARMRKKAATGRCEGRKPFGYYEGEQVILDRIRALRDGGVTYAAIAAKLNSEGVPPRKVGARWHPGHVHGLLHLKPLMGSQAKV